MIPGDRKHMLLLYNGDPSGSREARLVEKVHDTLWGIVRRNAVRILRSLAGDACSAATLEQLPFELWKGTNGFGDAFEMLYSKVPVSQYLEIELQADSYRIKTMYQNIAGALEEAGNRVRFIGMDVDTEDSQTVPTPKLETSSVAVVRALNDFEALVSSKGGPVSGLDRIHTALHGYLNAVCNDAGVAHSQDADIAALFKLIREQHPKIGASPPGIESTKILRGFAQIVDALNPIRNRHSMAHPNEELLEEPEALLAVNAVKSLLHYLNSKLR